MSNLVPEVRVNKNGVPVTKHINPVTGPKPRASFPTPSVASSSSSIALIGEQLKTRLKEDGFSGYTDRRKSLILKKLSGLKKETLEYLEPTFKENHYDRGQIEVALIELLDRATQPVKIDDVIHVLRDFEDPGYFEMWDASWRGHTPWGKYLVNILENRVLKNLDSMDIKGLEYRYESEGREPLRLQQGTDAERAKAVIGLLVNARSMNTELTDLNEHFSPGSKVAQERSTAFTRMFEHMDDYDHQKLFRMLMSDYFKDGLPYLKDESNMGSMVKILMESREYEWVTDNDAFAALTEIGLNSDYVMSEEAMDRMYEEALADLYHGRLVALAETYPDRVDAVVSYINDRGPVIPEAGSGALIAYLEHEVTPLRNGAL